MTQYLTYDMNDKIQTQGEKAFRKWAVRRVRTVGSPYSDCESAAFGLLSSLGMSSHMLRYAAMLVVLLVLGTTGAWGQSATQADGDGYYYIKNYNTAYYLKPAVGSGTNPYYQGNTEMPFLSTNTTGKVSGSLWILKRNGDYYQFIHA